MRPRRLRIRSLDVLRVQPGEVVVVQMPDRFGIDEARQVEAAFAEHDVRVLIIGGGLEIIAVQPPEPTFPALDSPGLQHYRL